MALNKRGLKMFRALDEQLNRVQLAVAEALRGLADDVDLLISENPGPAGPPGATGATGATGPAGVPTGVDFGKFGAYTDDNRIWGIHMRRGSGLSGGSNYDTWGMPQPANLNAGTQVAPSVTSPRAWNQFGTPAVANDFAGHQFNDAVLFAWVQRPRLQTLIRTGPSLATQRIWVALTASAIQASSTPGGAVKMIGLRYDSAVSANWYLVTGDGTTVSATDTGIAVAVDTDYFVDLDFTNASTLSLKINNVETTKTTNLPSGIDQGDIQITITTLAATAFTMLYHHCMFSRK